MPIPGTSRDAITLSREATGADSEGNPLGNVTVVGTFRGTWGSATAREQQVAEQRNQTLDAFCTMPLGCGVQIDDLVSMRGSTYSVVSVRNVIQHLRVGLREVTP